MACGSYGCGFIISKFCFLFFFSTQKSFQGLHLARMLYDFDDEEDKGCRESTCIFCRVFF